MTSTSTSDPFVWVSDYAISTRLCKTLIDKFEQSPNARPGVTAEGYLPKVKSSLDLHITEDPDFEEENTDVFNLLSILMPHYKKQLPFVPWTGDLMDSGYTIQKTRPGEGYTWHDDHLITFDPPRVRTVTFIFYLNTVEKGGETEFWNGFKIQPKKGRVLMFPAEFTYRHRGNSPVSGDKYICTGWFHETLPVH